MKSRTAIHLWPGAIPLAIVLVSFLCTSVWSQRPPNIVLIMADDLGVGDLGCYGQKIIRTPRIDALAREGLQMRQFYAGHNVCAPSRCALMTGYSSGHGVIRENRNPVPEQVASQREKFGWEFPGQIPIPDATFTLAEFLKDQGYATAAFGKWGLGHVGNSGDPRNQGFDLFYGYYCQVHAHNHFPKFLWRNCDKELLEGNRAEVTGAVYSQDRFIQEAMQFIEQHQNKPFFVYLPLTVPHLSIQVPDEELEAYADLPEEEYEHKAYLKHPRPRAGYAGMVSRLDRGIGMIVDLLDEKKLSENTLIVFTSDNGPTYDRLGGSDSDFFNSAAGLRGRKGSMYEGGIRAPCIVRWKSVIPEGRQSDWIGASWDLFPTIAEAIGQSIDLPIDGQSFWGECLGNRDSPPHRALYWESTGYGGQQALRQGRWKAVRTQLQKAHLRGEEAPIELYDLQEDPNERHDAASEHPEVVEQMRRQMADSRCISVSFPFPALDAPQDALPSQRIVGAGKDPSASRLEEYQSIEPFAIAIDSRGVQYVAEMTQHRVVAIDPVGNVRVVVGNGEKGFSGDGGPGEKARLNGPHHLLLDSEERLLIADTFNGAVRRWDPKTKTIETIAGTGTPGDGGDEGVANQTAMAGAYSLAMTPGGKELWVVDLENRKVRSIDLASGRLKTVAGNGQKGIPVNGQPATQQPLFDPRAIAIGADGVAYLIERGGHAVRRIDRDGTITTVAGSGKQGFSGDGGDPLAATFHGPKHAEVDAQNRLLVVDTENHAVRRIDWKEGRIETVAGTGRKGAQGIGGPANQLELNRPHGVWVDPSGWLWISDSSNNRVVRVRP
jgi:arylsulfatase